MKQSAIEERFTKQGYQNHLRACSAYPNIETVEHTNGIQSERLARSTKSSRPIIQN